MILHKIFKQIFFIFHTVYVHWLLFLILVLAIVSRFWISSYGYHVDIFSNAAWGQRIYEHGTKGFYTNSTWIYSWPTQPPIINLTYCFTYYIYSQKILWFFSYVYAVMVTHQLFPKYAEAIHAFVYWFGTKLYQDTPFTNGFLITIKLFPILADIIIASIIYVISRRQTKRAFAYTAIYLASPFSWYLSALWGQYDQVGFLLLLVAFLCLYKRWFVIAVITLFVSIGIKPTSLIFIPLFVWVYFVQKPKFVSVVLSCLALVIVVVLTTVPFTEKNLLQFVLFDLVSKIFYKSEFRLVNNAFNFWYVLVGTISHNQNWLFLFLPARIWGYVIYIILLVITFIKTKRFTIENLCIALFIVGFGSFLFLTNMLERYAFAGIVSGLLVCIYRPRMLVAWGLLSVIFWINLYHGWWFPEWLGTLHALLLWNNNLLTRLLAVINVAIFVMLVIRLLRKDTTVANQATASDSAE